MQIYIFMQPRRIFIHIIVYIPILITVCFLRIRLLLLLLLLLILLEAHLNHSGKVGEERLGNKGWGRKVGERPGSRRCADSFPTNFFCNNSKIKKALSQPAFICSKLTIETLEQGVKYVQS